MSDNPNYTPGFVPVGTGGQGEYKGSVHRYVHASDDSVAIYRYAPVKRTGAADATTGLPVVAAIADTDTPCGICVGFEVLPSSLNTMYCVASTRRVVLVADDPNLEFIGVGDDVGETLDVAHSGENVIPETSGVTASTISGNSNIRLDSSSSDTTNTLTIRLVKIYEEPGQNIATGDKYKKWVCRFNLHSETSTTGL
jgi:hypothetical protein